MEEERVVWSRVLDQPVHGSQDILLGGLAHGVLLVVGEDDHVLSLVTELFHQVGRHVAHVIDAAVELTALAKVVYAHEQGFSPTVTLRVLKVVALWCAVAKGLGMGRRRARSIVASVVVRIRICGGEIWAERERVSGQTDCS